MNRRQFLAAAGSASLLQAQAPAKLKTRTSKEIASSPISIGFETLDRKMFDPERTYQWIGQTGVKWARCQTGWARTETTRGQYDFAWLDQIVDRLLGLGIQPFFNLGYGNKLYIPAAPHATAVGWVPLYDDGAMEAWRRYVGKLAERFRDRVKHWELWNEPNIPNFWQPTKPNAADYVKLVAATAPVIRKAIKDVKLIGGAIAGLGETNDYIAATMEAGLGRYCDAFSYHPYRRQPELHYAEELATLRSILHRYKAGMPIWQGENGAPSEPKGYGALANFAWTEDTQAKWLLRRLILDLKLGVELTSYFLIVDLANYIGRGGLDGRTNFKGVLRATDYQPKQSFYALQNLCSLFDSDTKVANGLLRFSSVTGDIDEAAVYQASFTRKSKAMLVYWYPSPLPDPFTAGKTDLYVWNPRRSSSRRLRWWIFGTAPSRDCRRRRRRVAPGC